MRGNMGYDIPLWQLLVFHLLSDASRADKAVVFASLTRELTIALKLVSNLLPNESMPNVPLSSSCDNAHMPSRHAYASSPYRHLA